MSTTDQQFKRIQEKLQQLLKEYQAMKKENMRLQKELSLAQNENLEKKQNIEILKEQVSILKLSAGDMNAADKKELEKKINGYIKEIDRCIALLSH
jgi:hypothetical protein